MKIRDKERREAPHITIVRGTQSWRINLRTGEFMDHDPDPAEVPEEIVALIRVDATWRLLRDEWDRKYPTNPIASEQDSEKE